MFKQPQVLHSSSLVAVSWNICIYQHEALWTNFEVLPMINLNYYETQIPIYTHCTMQQLQ